LHWEKLKIKLSNIFDVDKFNLTKEQILLVFSAIEKRWTKTRISKVKNTRYILAMELIKVGIRTTDEKVIQDIWHDMLIGFFELIRLNDEARMKNEFPKMEDLLNLTLEKLASGELFDQRK